MAKKQSVESIQIKLCILGKEFYIDLSEKTAELCSEILAEAKRRLKLLKEKSKEPLVSEKEICKFLKDSIDKFLGSGMTDQIFGERPQEIGEVADLMCYIISKIRAGFESL